HRRALAPARLRRGGGGVLPPPGAGRPAPERTGVKRRPATAAGAAPVAVAAEGPGPEARRRAAPLGRKGWLVLAAALLSVILPVLPVLRRRPPPASGHIPFSDDFSDPGTVARNYRTRGGYYRVINGQLISPGTKNNPLWLDAELPQDVVIEVSAR